MSNSEPDTLTQDTVYDLLSNARRRFVLSYLRRRDEPVELSELSQQVAAWENDTDVEDLTDQQVKRVYVSLYQTHVPKLSDAGLLEYDKDAGEVALTSAVDQLETYLPDEGDGGVRWQLVYGAVAAAGLVAYAAVMVFPAAFAWVSMPTLNLVIIAAFAVVATAHYASRRWW
ncbi:DUF7344 domain-containing protein [Halobacterium yunchengense]|uniref:DUF7344 domain-containing protein n=1 Tax=Halobacterium yunchengense TaxID=3108497 RepID=UPI00300826F6